MAEWNEGRGETSAACPLSPPLLLPSPLPPPAPPSFLPPCRDVSLGVWRHRPAVWLGSCNMLGRNAWGKKNDRQRPRIHVLEGGKRIFPSRQWQLTDGVIITASTHFLTKLNVSLTVVHRSVVEGTDRSVQGSLLLLLLFAPVITVWSYGECANPRA